MQSGARAFKEGRQLERKSWFTFSVGGWEEGSEKKKELHSARSKGLTWRKEQDGFGGRCRSGPQKVGHRREQQNGNEK